MPATDGSVSVQIREASLEDHAQVAELETQYGLETKTDEEWKHLWVNNPIYRQMGKNWPIGWVLEDAKRKIVGYLGNIPLSYEFGGKTLLVATTHAWVVEPRYRSYSILLLDYFFNQKNVDLYLTTTLNSRAYKAFQFFVPSPVPVGEWDRSYFWITNYSGLVASALMRQGVPFAKALSHPLSLPLFFTDQLRRRHFGRNRREIEVKLCPGFDERFDTFWEAVKKRRCQVLLATRTREILDWHFKYALSQNKAWILCVTDGPRLVAYSTFYRCDSTRFGLKRVGLADFQTVTEDDSFLAPMLSCALECCQSAGIHMLEVAGLRSEKTRLIAKLAPYRRTLSNWSAFYKTNNPELAARLKDPKVWDTSCFDSDSSV